MNKKENILKKRSDYIKKIVANSRYTDKAVKILADQLYLSVATIYRDLAK